MHIAIFDDVSPSNRIGIPTLLSISYFLLSLTSVWDMIRHLCIGKGPMGHSIVLYSKSCWLTINQLDIILPVTVKWEPKIWIGDKIYQQHLSLWCHMSHRMSGQCVTRICMYDCGHTTFIHTSNCLTLRSDLVYMVRILKIASGRSWKSRQWSWIRTVEEVELY